MFRHYWVFAKLLITGAATVLLLVHMQPVGHLARAVITTTALEGELAGLRLQLIADAGAATVALVVATALSVFKPRGLTPFARGGTGWQSLPRQRNGARIGMILVGVGLGVGLGVFVVVHLLTGGAGH